MTKQEEQIFRRLIREETIGALSSEDGQNAITNAMWSESGQNAIVDAMNSLDGQGAVKRGALAALQSEEGRSLLTDSFVDNFNEVLLPPLDNITIDIAEIKADVARLTKSAVKREKFTKLMREKMLAKT